MRPRCRYQKDTLTLLQNRGNHVFRKIYREGERGRGRLEHEEINPARLILMRRFDLIIRMRFRVMIFQKVRMHQRDRAAVIVAMMGMEQRRGNQGDNHGHHTQTCAEPMHAADFLAPYGGKSTAHHFSTSVVQTAMQWTTIARIILILCLLEFAPHAFGQKVTFGAITGAQLTDDFRSLSCPDLGVTPNASVPGCPNIRGGSLPVATFHSLAGLSRG